MVENIQKNVKDKMEKPLDEPPKNVSRNSWKKEDFDFVIDPHAEKMQNMQDQLEALMHRKDLQEVGVTRPYPVEWESALFPKNTNL